jgi:gluconokinase
MNRHIIVMGVGGCGKSTVGKEIAQSLGRQFIEGDDFHTTGNIEKMRAGLPLNDQDRIPWLEAINRLMHSASTALVVSCSSLREEYRARLSVGLNPLFVYLKVSEETVVKRVNQRQHFFPASLISDQFLTLEPPEGKDSLTVDADRELEAVMTDLMLQLKSSY